jgi:hypothetical protein
VFFGKESEKTSEKKPIEQSSGEKQGEQPQPKPKPKLVRFHCDYCGRDGQKCEFFFKRKCEERMEKGGLTRTSTILPMVYLSLVCRCPGPKRLRGRFRLGESGRLQEVLLARLHRSDRCATPVRPVQVWADRGWFLCP